MPEAPQQIVPTGPADYLETMAKAIFQGGMSWAIVENKWPGIREALHEFDPVAVATLTEDDLAALGKDTRLIRNQRKIAAIRENARRILEIEEEHGNFGAYLRSTGDFEETARRLRGDFKYLGDFGCYWFLYVVGEPVPGHEEWMASRGRA